MEYTKTAIKLGDSVAITIPADLARYLGIKPGTPIKIKDYEKDKGKFIAMWKLGE